MQQNPDIEILTNHDKQIIQQYFKLGIDKEEDEKGSQYWWFLVTKITGNTVFENDLGLDDLRDDLLDGLHDNLQDDLHDDLHDNLHDTLRNNSLNTLETDHLESVIPDNHVPDINNTKHELRGSTLNQQAAWVYSNCLVFVTHSKMFKINVHKLIENQRVMENSRTINDAVSSILSHLQTHRHTEISIWFSLLEFPDNVVYETLNYLTGFTDIKTFRFPNKTHQDPKNLKIYHNLMNFTGTRLDVTNEMNERYTIIQKLVKLFKIQGLVRDEGWQFMYKVTNSLKFYEKDMIGKMGTIFTTKSKVVEWNQ